MALLADGHRGAALIAAEIFSHRWLSAQHAPGYTPWQRSSRSGPGGAGSAFSPQAPDPQLISLSHALKMRFSELENRPQRYCGRAGAPAFRISPVLLSPSRAAG